MILCIGDVLDKTALSNSRHNFRGSLRFILIDKSASNLRRMWVD
jgi:hypothetical protein